ncbi:MAG TPA: adenylate/guanylate cyclase domain-containing protein [Actinomycetota bacterium]|nr:adenylate/guanylate cyclase domain-containing protein [Actinomycetota bacterium]
MEPSEELRQVVRRFFDAVHQGDQEAVSRRFSREPGFERFGSDPAEWWQDGEASTRIWLQQMHELGGGFPWTLVGDVHAMTEGSVGWAGLRAEWATPNGPQSFRLTFVLHLEHGEWRIVHAHGSIPALNEEQGFLLTTSVDDIAESVTSTRPDLSATSAADGTVTIVFTDIEDSTRLNGFLGDERWVEVLRAHNGVLQDATSEFGGSVVKNQGDGFMLAFPSSRAAIRCAIAIERGIAERFHDPGSPVRVRIGIHVGEAVREADDFFGHAVAYAARIASAAAGGEIVVSSLVHELVGQASDVRFGDARTVELKGIAGSHRIYPVEITQQV